MQLTMGMFYFILSLKSLAKELRTIVRYYYYGKIYCTIA